MIVAPVSLTNSMTDRPIGPAPMTRTFSPACGLPRSTAWQPMASVSTRASCSSVSLRRRVQLAGRHDEARPQAAVGVDAEDLQVLAAVAAAAPAGEARLAVHVRLDGAAVARLDVGDAGADLEHLDAQFVAGDARIAVERHLAEIAADVGAADADAVDAHQRLAGAGLRRLVDGDLLEIGPVPSTESLSWRCSCRRRLRIRSMVLSSYGPAKLAAPMVVVMLNGCPTG